MHSLEMKNIVVQDNSYTPGSISTSDTQAQTISLIQINKLQNINIQKIIFQNHIEIAFASITQSKNAALQNITCSNDQSTQSTLTQRQYAGCFQFEDVNQLSIDIFNSSYIDATDNSILSIINQNYEKNQITLSNVEVFNCLFQQTKVYSSANSIYISSLYYTQVQITDSYFHDNQLNGLVNSEMQSTTAVQILNSGGDISLYKNTFSNSKSNSQYNFLYFQSNSTEIKNCNFTNSSFDLSDSNKMFKQQGGFLRVKTDQLIINNTNFSNSTSKIGSFVYIEPLSLKMFVQVNYSSFSQGYSIIDGAAIYLNPQDTLFSLSFNFCNFTDIYSNSSDSKSLSIGSSQIVGQSKLNQIELNYVNVLNSFGNSNSAFLNAASCQINTQNLTVSQNQNKQIINLFDGNKLFQTATFQVQNSQISIQNLTFNNIRMKLYSASPLLMSATSTNIIIQNSQIYDNYFSQSLIDLTSGQLDIQNTQFNNIQQFIPQSRILIDSTQNAINSYNSIIRISNSSLRIFENTAFSSIICLSNCYGSSIVSYYSTIIIQDSRFVDSQAFNGGAISLFGLNSNKNTIENTQFINNLVSQNGGAFYLQANQQDVFLLKFENCKFTQNKAQQGYGGAIYVNSQATDASSQQLNLVNSQIYENKALIAGGIYNQGIKPLIDSNSQINQNVAEYYGSDKFSYPQELFLVNEENFSIPNNQNGPKIILDDFKSGDTLPDFIFQLRDENQKVVVQLQGQQLNAEIKANNNLSFKGDTKVYIEPQKNVFIFNQIGLIGIPGKSSDIEFTSDSIKVFNPNTQNYEQNYSYSVQVNFRNCKYGEIKTQFSNNFYECQACQEGKYTLDYSGCYSCPTGGECTRGVIYLKQGFWREEQYSPDIIECTNRIENCVGDSYGNAVCTEGNIGPLCEECDIFINYIQIVSAAVSFNLNVGACYFQFDRISFKNQIKNNIKDVVEVVSYFGVPISTSVDYLECVLKDLQIDIPIIYLKLIVSLIMPILIFFIYLIYEVIVQKCKYKSKHFFSYSVYTAYIFLFIYLQPDLVSQMIGLLSCREIGKTKYILANMNYECYTDTYQYYSLALVLPILILWVIIVPTILFFKIYSSQRKSGLNFIKTNLKYGFLFQEYKDQLYLWEFIKIIQKIVIIMILNFYSQVVLVKGILIYLLILFYGVLTSKFKPYQLDQLNKIDHYSTQICAFTFLLCVFINNNEYRYFQVGCFIIIILINLFFIGYLSMRIVKEKYNQVLNILYKTFESYPKIQKCFKKRKMKINPTLKQKIRSSLLELQKMNKAQIQDILLSMRNTKTSQNNQSEKEDQNSSKQEHDNPFLRDLSPSKQLDSIPNSHRQMLSIETDSSNLIPQLINNQTERLYNSQKPKSLLSIEQKHMSSSTKPINNKFKISYLQALSGDILEESQTKEIQDNTAIDNNKKLNVAMSNQVKGIPKKKHSTDEKKELELIRISQIQSDIENEKHQQNYQNI